jgi:hypothetical protein
MSCQAISFLPSSLADRAALGSPKPGYGPERVFEPVIARNLDSVGNLLLIVMKWFTLILAQPFLRRSAFYGAQKTLK